MYVDRSNILPTPSLKTGNSLLVDADRWMRGFPGGTTMKILPANAGGAGGVRSITGSEDPLEEGMAPHSRILAWRIPRTKKPGGLHAVGLNRVGHKWATNTFTFFTRNKERSRKPGFRPESHFWSWDLRQIILLLSETVSSSVKQGENWGLRKVVPETWHQAF